MKSSHKTITLCSSASFLKEVIDIGNELKRLGFKVLVPDTALRMAQSNDYNIAHYKPWLARALSHSRGGGNLDKNITPLYNLKAKLIRGHFKKIEKADAILVVNGKKHGVDGYIGGNTLMEMAIAFYLNKPIYVLNEIRDKKFLLYEEILGLNSIFIDGDLSKIK